MRTFFRDKRGNILAFTAAAIFTILIFAASVTDIGYILTAQNQLQGAVDSAALAGAAGLIKSQSNATSMAIRLGASNNCMKIPVNIVAGDITFPTSNRIRVQTSRQLDTFFLRLSGMNTKTIRAEATGELSYINGTTGMRPFIVPDRGWVSGDHVIIKSGNKDAPATTPCWHYPVNYPAVNRGQPVTGADEYRDNLRFGSGSYIEVGDVLQVEPGNMVGPTSTGVDYLIDQDPNAYWGSGGLTNSSFPGSTSPRVIFIPLYDPAFPPGDGRTELTVTALAAFFVEGTDGKDVIGVFMEILSSKGTKGNTQTLLRGVKLIS